MLPFLLRRTLAATLSLPQLLTSAKTFEENFLIGSRRLNRFGLHGARVRLAHRVAALRRRKLAHRIAPEDLEAFERDGFVVRRNFLPPREFADLKAEIAAYHCRVREKFEGGTKLRKIRVSQAVIAANPALGRLLNHPDWRGLIRYVGAYDGDPTVFLESVLRHYREGDLDPQTLLHADTFHPTAKAWLYLTDVPEDGGPLVYVPGSHRLTPERLAWEEAMSLEAASSANREIREGSFRIEPAALPRLKLPKPRALSVPANTLVVADTFGFHARGPSPAPSVRVDLWGIAKRTPFLPWAFLDAPIAGVWMRGDDHDWQLRDGVSAFDPD